MTSERSVVRRAACVGTGTVGAGWAALMLARGVEVIGTDPHAAGETRLRAAIDAVWPTLEAAGLVSHDVRDSLRFVATVEEAVADVDWVQESAPDDESLKIALLARIDAACPAQAVVASSSSTFVPSNLASACRQRPERIIVGHPFVPIYLIPLVEVVGGPATDPEVLERAMAFYTALGKQPLRLKKEIRGYVANRLQRALLAEALSLVEQGVCEYADIDTAVTAGPGLRWAYSGPVLHRHLGGGKGGVRHMIAHLGWPGAPGGEQAFIEAVEARWGHVDMDTLEGWRDRNLVTLLKGLEPPP